MDFFPAEEVILKDVDCEYESLEGFDQEIRGIRSFDQLPKAAQRYIQRVEEILQVPILMVGTGPSRNHILSVHH